MIYLDNAATSLKKPQAVIDAVVDALHHLGNAGRGSTESSMTASRVIFHARQKLNELINGEDPRQIIFTHNATESLNIAIKGLFSPGDHVITTVMEHNSVLRPLYELQSQGLELTILPITDKGIIDPKSIEKNIKENTKGMVITHASNVTGNINPIKEVTEILHKKNILCIVDGSQTIGAMPINIRELDADVFCFTGHKSLLGPQGTGGLYIRPGIQIRPLKTGGTGVDTFNPQHPSDYPTALEAGTLNGHGIAGLLAAVEYLLEYGVENIQKEERNLLDYFVKELESISNIQFYGSFDPAAERTAIVSININGLDSAQVVEDLIDAKEIMTRGGGHCAPLMHQALGTKEQGVVRFSLSHYTTIEELNQTVAVLKQIAAETKLT